MGGFSAHADQQAMMNWLDGFERPPLKTFVVHGEETAAFALADSIASTKNWNVAIPEREQWLDVPQERAKRIA